MISVIRPLLFVRYFMKTLKKLYKRVNFSSLNQPFFDQQYLENGKSKQRVEMGGAGACEFFQKWWVSEFSHKKEGVGKIGGCH